MPDMNENRETQQEWIGIKSECVTRSKEQMEIEFLKKEVEVLKKRVDYFYNEIRPYIQIANCKRKYAEVNNNGNVVNCYKNHPRSCCCYNETVSPDDRFDVTEKGKEYLSSH